MKIYPLLFITLSFSIFFYSCQKDYPECPETALEEGSMPAEETDIINVIMSAHYSSDFYHLIQQTFSDNDSASNTRYILSISSLHQLNIDTSLAAEYALKNQFSLNIPVTSTQHFIHQSEINCMFSRGCEQGWEAYRNKYRKSKGFISFGRPAISCQLALIEYGVYYDCLGGTGYLVLLKKQDGKWLIYKRIETWIS